MCRAGEINWICVPWGSWDCSLILTRIWVCPWLCGLGLADRSTQSLALISSSSWPRRSRSNRSGVPGDASPDIWSRVCRQIGGINIAVRHQSHTQTIRLLRPTAPHLAQQPRQPPRRPAPCLTLLINIFHYLSQTLVEIFSILLISISQNSCNYNDINGFRRVVKLGQKGL